MTQNKLLHPRTPETQAAYEKFKNDPNGALYNQKFNLENEEIVKDYQYWAIIKNKFPYDTMVRVNDMLISKRAVGNFSNLNETEIAEYYKIIDELTEDGTYDAKIENFSKSKSVKDHIHIHLVCWHNTK